MSYYKAKEGIKRTLGAWGVAFSTALILLVIAHFSLWHLFAVPHLEPLFIDWYALLAASDCKALGMDPFKENPCDIIGRKHIYGSVWLYLSNFGLSRADLFWSGLSFFVLPYILTASLTLNPRTLKQSILALSLILSPASLIGIERANADIGIYSLLFIGAILLLSGRFSLKLTGLVCIFITGPMKLYSFAALTTIITMKKKSHLLVFLSIAIASVALYIWIAWDEIVLLNEVIGRPKYGPVFGAELLFHRLNQIQAFKPLYIISTQTATIIAAGITTIVALSFKHIFNGSSAPARETVLLVAGSSILTATFFLNTNYDYRCIFIIFTIPYLCLRQGCVAKLAIGLSIYVMWASRIHYALYYTLGPGRMFNLSFLIEFSVTYVLIAILMSATINVILTGRMESEDGTFRA
jgi:hypothetical protein